MKNLTLALSLGLALTACGQPAAEAQASRTSQTKKEASETEKPVTTRPSTHPDLVTVEAKFDGHVTPGKIEDEDGTMVNWLMANIPSTKYSVPINDYLYLGRAATKEFISPALNGCKLTTYMFDYVGPGNQTLNFGGRDSKGSKACANFFAAIARNGLQMEFTDVPLLNGAATIKKVRVNISNP